MSTSISVSTRAGHPALLRQPELTQRRRLTRTRPSPPVSGRPGYTSGCTLSTQCLGVLDPPLDRRARRHTQRGGCRHDCPARSAGTIGDIQRSRYGSWPGHVFGWSRPSSPAMTVRPDGQVGAAVAPPGGVPPKAGAERDGRIAQREHNWPSLTWGA